MSNPEKELSKSEASEKEGGVILGYWDHEKTPLLIQDLEHSVSLVERKCKKLLKDLIFYKKYLEKSEELDFHPIVSKKKVKKSKNQCFLSGSDPDFTFRKKLINFQEIQKLFEQKFEEKLSIINRELTEAAHKIGLKGNIILSPMNDCLKAQNQVEDESSRLEVDDKFLKLNFLKAKSDSTITERDRKTEFSRITQNELELYQKLSRLSIKKKKKKHKSRKVRFFCRRNTPKPRLGLKAESYNSECGDTNVKRKKKRKNSMIRMTESRLPRNFCSVENSQEKLNELEVEKMCNSLKEIFAKKAEPMSRCTVSETKPDLRAAIRKTVPFTTCTSTSRSHNICLNIQQLLSLCKREKIFNLKTKKNEKIRKSVKEQSLGVMNCRQNVSERERGILWPPLENKSSAFENDAINLIERKDKVWISERCSSNCRKARSKYTGGSSEGFTYHKSTMKQFTRGRKSMIKSESKTAYAVGSKIMVSDCQRTDIFDIGKNSCFENAGGDGSCNEKCAKLNRKWAKVYSSFLSIYRKYTSLKEKVQSNNLALADADIKTLENEIDYSIGKYKDFLHFYTKFLHLNHRLQSLKIACETKMFGPLTSFYPNYHGKLCSYETNYSIEIKKVFREIQALQDKISQVKD